MTARRGTCYDLESSGREGCVMPNDLSQDLPNDVMQLPDEQRAALAAASTVLISRSTTMPKRPGRPRLPAAFAKWKAGRAVN